MNLLTVRNFIKRLRWKKFNFEFPELVNWRTSQVLLFKKFLSRNILKRWINLKQIRGEFGEEMERICTSQYRVRIRAARTLDTNQTAMTDSEACDGGQLQLFTHYIPPMRRILRGWWAGRPNLKELQSQYPVLSAYRCRWRRVSREVQDPPH